MRFENDNGLDAERLDNRRQAADNAAADEPAGAATEAAAGAPDASAAERRIAELEAEVAELVAHREQAAKAQANFENASKRLDRDLERARKYAFEEAAKPLLEIKDSLERAAACGGIEGDALRGLELTLKQFGETLARFAVEEINPAGAPFDPAAHEAIGTRPDAQRAPGTVLEIVQKGYRLHDRLLRPARVIISAPAEDEAPDRG